MTTSETVLMDVLLEGGPAHFPTELRTRQAPTGEHHIKVQFYGGYEHFERSTPDDRPGSPAVFTWTRSTRIAE